MVKKRIRQLLYVLINIRTFFFLEFYKIRNRRKDRLFIFTDSRGFEISKIGNRKSPFESYLLHFVKAYCCELFICPQKHTTIFDFLYAWQREDQSRYRHVIAHIGVVDFSPRPASAIAGIVALKRRKIIDIFGSEFYDKIKTPRLYQAEYAGEKTAAILHEDDLAQIADRFNKIPGLIWISCNPVDQTWRGNYKKDRPLNIDMVNEKSRILKDYLDPDVAVIDLTDWSVQEVHKFTCDNIHLSAEGMEYIENSLKQLIRE